MARRYRFIGEGAGVPGLPHEITDEEALQSGLSEVLQAAIANGNYAEVEAEGKAARETGEEGD